jgi:hypothetical protein
MKGNKQTQQKSFTCHHGKGKVIDKGHKTECTQRHGKNCQGAGSKCTRV